MLQAILEADAIIAGAPGRQGGMCGEMRLFLDTWAKHQTEQKVGFGALKVCIHQTSVQCSFVHTPGVIGARHKCQHVCCGRGLQLRLLLPPVRVAASMPAPYHMIDMQASHGQYTKIGSALRFGFTVRAWCSQPQHTCRTCDLGLLEVYTDVRVKDVHQAASTSGKFCSMEQMHHMLIVCTLIFTGQGWKRLHKCWGPWTRIWRP